MPQVLDSRLLPVPAAEVDSVVQRAGCAHGMCVWGAHHGVAIQVPHACPYMPCGHWQADLEAVVMIWFRVERTPNV